MALFGPSDSELDAKADEAHRFAMAANAHLPSGLSLPFATAPLNVYVRLTPEQEAMPEPDLHNLLAWARRRDGGTEVLSAVLHRLWRRTLSCEDYRCVDTVNYLRELPYCRPSRICSAKLILDIDELDCRRLAIVLWAIARGLDAEMSRLVSRAREVVQDAGNKVGEQVMRYVGPTLWTERDTVFWSATGWITCAGYVLPQNPAHLAAVGTYDSSPLLATSTHMEAHNTATVQAPDPDGLSLQTLLAETRGQL